MNGKWKFECQHGIKECYANKVHSCALNLNPVPKGVDFVACSMSSSDPSSDKYLKMVTTYVFIFVLYIQVSFLVCQLREDFLGKNPTMHGQRPGG